MERVSHVSGGEFLVVAVVGPWAKEKLTALARYLDFYTKVLKNQSWRTIYLDAFAGGGRALIRAADDPDERTIHLFVDADHDQQEFIDGSPRVALNVANPFSRYIFVEPNSKRIAELEALKAEFGSSRHIDILKTDAAAGIDWMVSQRISKAKHRGVAFLDPFGAGLEWSSIEKLASSELFEVVVNFALNMAIQRMMPNNGQLQDGWRSTLDAYFGTPDWFDEVYVEQEGLFGQYLEKRQDYSERLLSLYRKRLKQAFGHVSTPRLIKNTRGVPLYYLLWAGPHPKGREGADYILKMGETQSARQLRRKTA